MKVERILVGLLILGGVFMNGCAESDSPTDMTANEEAEAELSTSTICGDTDDRVLSNIPEIGRVRGPAVCSGTLIGRRCLVTAGHCARRGTNDYVEFNVPVSEDGNAVASARKDYYRVRRIISARDRGKGNDYAVMQLYANSVTGKYPGDVQGYIPVDLTRPVRGTTVRISGYGADRGDDIRHLAQQTHSGKLVRIGSSIRYNADTMGGNSGSSVIDERTGKVIGVHTHGGCSKRSSSSNSGTSIYYNYRFRRAVQRCLRYYDR